MNEAASNVLRFDHCELDLDRRELYRDGELVPLEPRVFALLVFLIQERHRAVDKDEIQDAVWAGSIVSETALTRAIMKLRRALGDSADTQQVIRTVHGHGYRFVAALDDQSAADDSKDPGSSPWMPRAFAAAFVLVLVGFIAYLWPTATHEEGVHIAIMPVENETDDPEYDWARLGLLGFASDLIVEGSDVTVVAASDAIRFTEVNGQPDADGAEADLERLRDVYGATYLLLSRLEKNAGTLRLSYTLHSASGGIERGTMVGAEPTSLMRGLVQAVIASLGTSSASIETTIVADDPFINEAYSRAIALALEGRCGDAQKLFDIVIASSESISRAHFESANCARILGQWQEAETAFLQMLSSLPTEPATTLRALAHHGLGSVYIRTGRGDAARQTLTDGLAVAQQAGDRVAQGMILNNLAIEAKDRREHDEARDLLHRATLAYTEAKRGILPGQLPAALANIDMAEGKLDDADAHLQQALEAFRAIGDRRNEAMMLNNVGYLRRLQGRIDEAEPYHLESLAIRRDIGDRVGQGRILGMLSILYENEGRYDEARDAASEAFDIASEANDRLFMATALAQLGQAEFSDGRLDEARAAYADSAAIFEEIDDISRAAQVSVRLARIDVQAGDIESASARVDALLNSGDTPNEPAIESLELRGDIRLLESDPAGAASAYQQALDRIHATGFVVTHKRVAVKLANVLLDSGNLAAAEIVVGALLEESESADTLRVRARLADLQGDTRRAAELVESIARNFADDWTSEDEARLADYRTRF